MRVVSGSEWQAWHTQGSVLEQDRHGPKVIALPDGSLVKIFRPRRRLWLARLLPSALRFSRNAAQLNKRGIAVPTPAESIWIDRSKAVSACLYAPLPGESLLTFFRRSPAECTSQIPALARFIRHLHRQGIYFRSLHLGNVIWTPDRNFGLIDFLDLRIKPFPLSPRLAKRNLAHFKKHLVRRKLDDFPFDMLVAHYERSQD